MKNIFFLLYLDNKIISNIYKEIQNKYTPILDFHKQNTVTMGLQFSLLVLAFT